MEKVLIDEDHDVARIRPLFLTVLCIISFLNCALILWSGISNMGESVEDHIKQNALITTIGAIFSIIGTALMWNIREFGFWLNFTGTIFAIAGPIFIFGIDHVISFSSGYPAYVSLMLMLLFALNYKHMD